jgi:hypothetical protein
MPDDFEDRREPGNLDDPPAFFPYEEGERAESDSEDVVSVGVQGVFAAENAGQISRFVLLSDGNRKLRILIGYFEALAILQRLENSQAARPLTHDLLKTVVERLDATVDRVVIDDYWNSVYYAKLYLNHNGNELEIDTRPSDAIAVAMRFGAPIYVAEKLLEYDPFE